MQTTRISIATLVFTVSVSVATSRAEEGEFLKTTIDLGCVVSDIDAAVKFYTEAIGFQESGGYLDKIPAH